MSTAEERRERLKNELRKELAIETVRTPASEPDVASASASRVASLRLARERAFSGSGAKSIISGAGPDPIQPRALSPRRVPSMRAGSPSFGSQSGHALAAPPEKFIRGQPPAPVVPSSLTSEDLLGPVSMSNQPHHSRIVIPGEARAPESSLSHDKLWVTRPLSDGTRYIPSKRLSATPQQFQSSISVGVAPPTAPADRSESPHTGKKVIPSTSALQGSAATVVKDQPRGHTPHRIDKYHTTGAPFLEHAAVDSPGGRSGAADKAADARGLLGFGPTGRRKLDVGDAGNLVEFKPSGWGFVDGEKRCVAKVEGRTESQPYTSVLYRQTPDTEPPKEVIFRPSVVVMSGPPAFVPQAPAPRSNSPTLRYNGERWQSDIFHHKVSATPATATNSPRRGRSPGTYSPNRATSPWRH